MPRPENVRPIDRPREDPNATIDRAISVVGGKRTGGDTAKLHCPVPGHGNGRGDKNPSLELTAQGDKLLWHCWAGCPQEAVQAALQDVGVLQKGGGPRRPRRPDPKTQAVDNILGAFEGPAPVERPAGVPADAKLEWAGGEDDDGLYTSERAWTWKDADGKPHVVFVEEEEIEAVQPDTDHPVPTEHVAMCASQIDLALAVAEHAAARLAFVREERVWLAFWPGKGWETVHPGDLLERLMEFGRNNLASVVDGKWKLSPRAGGSRGTAEGVAAALSGVPGVATAAADWDADMDVLGLPGGKMVQVSTSEIRNLTVSDRVRWRVSCFPATDAELQDSQFLAVVEHGIPDDQEREYVQRRIGAALSDTQGHDDLIVFVGPAACGKGTILEALKEVFGSYAGVVPANEIQIGGRRSHSAWLAALRGRRLLCCDDMPQRDLDVSAVKQILGSVVSAQHMRTAPTDFRLHAPLLATANHSPTIGAADSGLRRRLKPITCGASIPEAEQDPKVRASMSSPKEQAAAFRWALDGAGKYRGGGCSGATVDSGFSGGHHGRITHVGVRLRAVGVHPGRRGPGVSQGRSRRLQGVDAGSWPARPPTARTGPGPTG